MELYVVQEDEFHYGSIMLELAIALHSLGDFSLEDDKWVHCDSYPNYYYSQSFLCNVEGQIAVKRDCYKKPIY